MNLPFATGTSSRHNGARYHRVIRLIMIRAILIALFTTLVYAAPPDTPTLLQPTGEYRLAWISLEAEGGPFKVFLALRDNKPVQFWSTRTALPGTGKPQGTLKLLTDSARGDLNDTRLKAELNLRLVSIWAPTKRLNLIQLSLDLSRQSDTLTGTWALQVDGKAGPRGNAAGKITSGTDAIAADQAWPGFFGVDSTARGPDFGKPMIRDLSDALPLWRSETLVLSGWGTGADARYKSRAIVGTLCGGTSSPVVAQGMVFLYHYRPSGEVEPTGDDAALVESFKDHPIERDWMRRWFSKRADVVLTAIDGATGRTVWESVWPLKQGNFQTHKWRGLNFVPAISGDTIVAVDYSFGVHAHDTKTGRLKWSRAGAATVAGDKGTVGPVVAAGSVIIAGNGDTVGLDLSTGKELFKAPRALSARLVRISGKERVLLVGSPLTLLDPADGKVLWKSELASTDKLDVRTSMPVCDGGKVVFPRLFDEKKKQEGAIVAYTLTDSGLEKAWESQPDVTWDENLFLCIAHNHVYAACKDALRSFDLATGKPVQNIPELKCGSNAVLTAVDNRLFYQLEGQHGRQWIHLLDATIPSALKVLGKEWRPPHNDTTAYGVMPLANIVVDGRLIIRGMDGIYCYDLRGKSEK